MYKQRIPRSRPVLWRFLERHDLTFKKAYVQPSDIEPTSLETELDVVEKSERVGGCAAHL
jgi:hypothetical protein